MIRCTDVSKSYRIDSREVRALRGFSMSIEHPGFYAIMGQSGSGKSTLLHLLAGLDRPDSGEIVVADRAIHTMGERDATHYRRTGMGIVFQQFNLIPTLTALENVELPGLLAGETPRALRVRSEALLGQLGVIDRAGHRPDAMSGGEQQRVAIARALLFSPPVLLADEPSGNLDSENSERLWSLLESLAHERRMTIVMVTHEPAAAAHCTRVFVLKDGALHGEIEVGSRMDAARTAGEGLDAAGVAARYQQCLR
jgi:putative ABC transport system ATP-binding protein